MRKLVAGRRLELSEKTVLVLGGAGMVGQAICVQLLNELPKKLIVHSLFRGEAEEAAAYLNRTQKDREPKVTIAYDFGNIFVREDLKDEPRRELMERTENRTEMIEDILSDLSNDRLQNMALWKLIDRHKPQIVLDCINTATAIAYQNIYDVANQLYKTLCDSAEGDAEQRIKVLKDQAERLLCSLYVPQLVRHVQVLSMALQKFKVEFYLKVGTTGTGGMGLNIPYTHGEDKPSKQLMSKTAMAGAHTLLLYLMHATPEPPITREIKPSAAVAWKEIGFKQIRKRGQAIELYDCSPNDGFSCRVGETLFRHVADDDGRLVQIKDDQDEPETLQSVCIDTGENGLFSRGEFTAITTQNQMEFVTPEEIAANVIYEIRGSNTGCDILGAIRSATMGPSYRAAFIRGEAIEQIKELEKLYKGVETDLDADESIAFEILGPPMLSKLLFEAYLLKRHYKTIDNILAAEPEAITNAMTKLIADLPRLRSKIISVGIPILLPDGQSFLRGRDMSIPDFSGEESRVISEPLLNQWADQGWVDLRQSNWKKWRERLLELKYELSTIPEADQKALSSFASRPKSFWDDEIDIGELVGWIFIYLEEGGRRGYAR
jgi:hypothetical protein